MMKLTHPVSLSSAFEAVSYLYSPKFTGEGVDHPANADAKVGGCANKGEPKVEANAGVNRPALLDLLEPEQQKPGHDEEHADADEELDVEVGDLHDFIVPLHVK